MEIIENQRFTREAVSLDNRSFINCAFTECTLLYSGEELTWFDTKFSGCKFKLSGAASRTAMLLETFGQKVRPQLKENLTE